MGAPLITVRNLSHSFGEGALARKVLHEISLDFYPGEIVIIMGPSGAGKTTLLSLAGALRSVQSGSIRVAGAELGGASSKTLMSIRRRIGFVFQAHNLVESLTIRENVQMSLMVDPAATAASSRKKALDLLKKVGLAQHADKRPRQLSGGQKQRAAIARALVRSPEIVMADEPTAALDKQSGREVVELLQYLAKELQCAVLLVTHDNRILDIADRILTLEDGKIDETDLALDRLIGECSGLMDLLARYPSSFGSLEPIAQLALEFESRMQSVKIRLAELVSRRQSGALAARAGCWSTIAEDIRHLEDSLREMAEQLRAMDPENQIGLHFGISQSIEFLLVTAANCFHTRDLQDARTVLKLTSNRGEAQAAIRRGYSAAEKGDDPRFRDWAVDVIDLYFRCVYFLNRIGGALARDIEAGRAH